MILSRHPSALSNYDISTILGLPTFSHRRKGNHEASSFPEDKKQLKVGRNIFFGYIATDKGLLKDNPSSMFLWRRGRRREKKKLERGRKGGKVKK